MPRRAWIRAWWRPCCPTSARSIGNAGSTSHVFGRECHEAVEQSRRTIAQAIHAEPREIVFTSGATESNNLAIRGLAERTRRRGHISSVCRPNTRPFSIRWRVWHAATSR